MRQHRSHISLPELLALRSQALQLPLARRRGQHSPQGNRRSLLRGRGMEFSEFRPYQAGDDIRAIDWHLTARKQKPFTRLYQEEIEQPVFLLVDQRPNMFFGSCRRFKSVMAAEAATLLFWAGLHRQDRIGGMILGVQGVETSRPVRRESAAITLLHQVSQANQDLSLDNIMAQSRPPALGEALLELRRLAAPGSLCFLLTDGSDIDREQVDYLAYLQKHLQLVLILIQDPLEAALPKGRFNVCDALGQPFLLDLEPGRRQAEMQTILKIQREERLALLVSRGIQWLECSTEDNPLDALQCL